VRNIPESFYVLLTGLASGTPEKVEKEAIEMVKSLNIKNGEFVCEVVR
jgi:hypothetical protein